MFSDCQRTTHVWFGGIGCTLAGREAFGASPRGGGATADAIVLFGRIQMLRKERVRNALPLEIWSGALVVRRRVGDLACSWLYW